MHGKDLKISLLFDFYGEMLTEKQKEVIDLYYNNDLSLAEIAEHTLITRQGVRDNIKRAEATLLEMEEKLGFAARFEALSAGVSALMDQVDAFELLEKLYPLPLEIRQSLDAILDSVRDVYEKFQA